MPGKIVDAFGRTAIYHGTGSRYESPSDDAFRLNRPRLDKDIAYTLDRYKHRVLLADSRYISTWSTVQGAVSQKAEYVSRSGWLPQFEGEDHEWGRRAEALQMRTTHMTDVRGFAFSFAKCWEIASRLWDIDGDFFRINLKTKSGFPMSQFIEAHRVGSRAGHGNAVQGGRYDGAREINGIVYNDSGREIAYHVLGSVPERDKYISARDMHHCYDPLWFSENRGMPSIAYAVLDWYDMKETREAEKISQKANSMLTMVESTESGAKSINDTETIISVERDDDGNVIKRNPSVETIAKGLIRVVKSGSGEIKAHESNRPSNGWLAFDEKIEKGAFYGMGWRREMAFVEKLPSAAIHAFTDQINTTIKCRFAKLCRYAKQQVLWNIQGFIDRGDLEENPEWDKWSFTPPAEFTANPSRAMSSDLAALRAGILTEPQLIKKQGRDTEAHLIEKANYIKTRNTVAKKFDIDPTELGTTSMPGDKP